jgi:hypothetical protein
MLRPHDEGMRPIIPHVSWRALEAVGRRKHVACAFLDNAGRRFVSKIGAWGNNDGEEDNAEPSVDKGRAAHAEVARARTDEDNGDRAEAQAEHGCVVSAGIKADRDAGRRSGEEEGVKVSCALVGGISMQEQTGSSEQLPRSEVMRLLLELHKENSLFVRHYEDTRFKFAQITIALAAALVGVSRFPSIGSGSQHWIALCIIALGLFGVLITLKYTERADRHAAISRAFRRAMSEGAGDEGGHRIEDIYEDAVRKHAARKGITGLMHNIRARWFWVALHCLVLLLGGTMLLI